MTSRMVLVGLILAAGVASAYAQTPPIINAAPEQKLIIPKIPDGAIPPAVGVQNIQVFRATTSLPDAQDEHGWTYNHHVDMAIFHNHYLLAFTNGEKDEDVWPAHELYTTSEDGIHWTWPTELFPRGVSTSLRMYFYHSNNNRLLAIAGLRIGTEKLDEATKGGVVVREIFPDMKPGEPYTLIPPPKGVPFKPTPAFDTCRDKDFISACRELLANHPFLEQQDMGTLLGNNRMAVYQGANRNFGKALNFFRRKDGALVGISKNGFTILSTDEGKSWSAPVIPPTLLTNNAKVWTQKTSDDRFAMIYNPTGRDRFPLAITTSDDGITFNAMRVIHGEVPLQRYPGLNKNLGAQYIRGVSIFANDGSRKDKDVIVAYSSNKEDIWISRIPIPVKSAETAPVADTFDAPGIPGVLVPDWNIYSPKWASVAIVDLPTGGKALQLQDRDPFDYARAERIFPESKQVTLQFTLRHNIAPGGELDIDLSPTLGAARPVRLVLTADGLFQAAGGKAAVDLAMLPPDKLLPMTLVADASAGTFSITIAGKTIPSIPFAEPAGSLAQITFRTGPHRGIGELATAAVAGDRPIPPSTFFISDVSSR